MNTEPLKRGSKKPTLLIIISFLIIGVITFYFIYQKPSSGDGNPTLSTLKETSQDENSQGEMIDFLDPRPIGQAYADSPQISNLAVTDLDGDQLLDIVVCDTKNNTVSWIRQFPSGTYTESLIAADIRTPAHVQVLDFDGDGDPDLMVAVLGVLYPNNDKIGDILILENKGNLQFKKRLVAEKIARVSDVRAGDLDGDGDMDLAAAQFGFSDGETRWMENLGNWTFKTHILQNLSGPINVIITDIDQDKDLDIVSLVSQEWEEIYCFVNNGKGVFEAKLLWGSSNEDFGSSGIYMADIDQDGDEDILYTNGDSFNYSAPAQRPWHGVQWLENKGDLNFEYHRLSHFPGTYNCRPADIDRDGDTDLFAVSGFNAWDKEDAYSFMWLENTGNMKFVKRMIANKPTHLITLETGDFNNDGLTDMVTGGMYLYPPYNRMSRVTLWINNGKLSSNK